MIVPALYSRPASFRGVPFFVEEGNDFGAVGRRVPVHAYVNAEHHDTEDMGPKVPTWRLKAYVAADAFTEAAALALSAACAAKGAGLLVTPLGLPQLVRCTGCDPSHRKDRLGYVAFDLTFVAAGGGGAFVVPVPASAALGAFGAVAGAVRAAVGLVAAPSLASALRAGATVGAAATAIGGALAASARPF